MPPTEDRRVRRIVVRHLLLRFDPTPETWEAAQVLADDPLAGLDPAVADRVVPLPVRNSVSDLARLCTYAALVPSDAVEWPDEPAKLEQGRPILLSSTELEEVQADEQADDQLALLEQDLERARAEGWRESDLLALRNARRRRLLRFLVPETLAFYRPFSASGGPAAARELMSADPTWGIYLSTGGIERLAQRIFVPAGLDDTRALQCAMALLLGHEIGRLIVDLSLAHEDPVKLPQDAGGLARTPLAEMHHRQHDPNACRQEEAFAQGHALVFFDEVMSTVGTDGVTSALRLTDEEVTAVQDAAAAWVGDGLPGYRDGATLRSQEDVFEALVALLRHIGCDDPEAAALAGDLNRRRITTADVPIHVVVSPGSAYSRGGWMLIGGP